VLRASSGALDSNLQHLAGVEEQSPNSVPAAGDRRGRVNPGNGRASTSCLYNPDRSGLFSGSRSSLSEFFA